ncbi:MAG: hypothetical protein K2N11_02005 [Mucispirillum sp.]|nr:hypothetical protein [Mucispirillum sp.]
MGFSGNYLNKFDDAGRLSLPAKMREELRASFGNDALMAYTVSGIVKIYPKSVYDMNMRNMHEAAKKDAAAYKIFRQLSSSAFAVEINSSGRMNIPAQIRQSADLKEECYVIGAYDVIELWNKEKWEKESASFDLALENNAAVLAGFMDMIVSE